MEAQLATPVARIKKNTLYRVLRLATALGALLLLLFLVVQVKRIYHLSADAIYHQSYVPYKLSIAHITDTSTFTTIELFYAEKDYDEVVHQSKNLLSVLDRERLLIGVSYLQKEEYLPAISWLNRLADLESNPYQQDAQFYLTLTHLKNGDYDRTIELMQTIIDNKDHPYHNRFTTETVREVSLLKWK